MEEATQTRRTFDTEMKTYTALWVCNSVAYKMLAYLEVATDIPAHMIHWGGKEPRLVEARWAMFWALRKKHQWKWLAIARFFRMNHATVIHGVNKADRMIETDPAFRKLVDDMLVAVA